MMGQFTSAKHPKDPARAITYLKIAADLNELGSTHNLGLHYLQQGQKEEGIRYVRKAAELGHGDSALTLADMAKDAGNAEEELKWLQRAADDAEHPEGCARAGSILHNQKQHTLAAKYYIRGIKAGDWHFNCTNNLANCYLDGRGVTVNLVEAMRLFRNAAKNNQGTALFGIHKILCMQVGGEGDWRERKVRGSGGRGR
jgi:TPR repeat protein